MTHIALHYHQVIIWLNLVSSTTYHLKTNNLSFWLVFFIKVTSHCIWQTIVTRLRFYRNKMINHWYHNFLIWQSARQISCSSKYLCTFISFSSGGNYRRKPDDKARPAILRIRPVRDVRGCRRLSSHTWVLLDNYVVKYVKDYVVRSNSLSLLAKICRADGQWFSNVFAKA